MKEEVIISKEDLALLFEKKRMLDTEYGWYLDGSEVEIIALHNVEPKFLQDIANAKLYKLKRKDGKKINI